MLLAGFALCLHSLTSRPVACKTGYHSDMPKDLCRVTVFRGSFARGGQRHTANPRRPVDR